jgi:hypothetical protein
LGGLKREAMEGRGSAGVGRGADHFRASAGEREAARRAARRERRTIVDGGVGGVEGEGGWAAWCGHVPASARTGRVKAVFCEKGDIGRDAENEKEKPGRE